MAIRLIEHPNFPNENIFGALFYEGKDDSEDEKITLIKDGFIFTEQNKYSMALLRRESAEIIFPQPSEKLLNLINFLV